MACDAGCQATTPGAPKVLLPNVLAWAPEAACDNDDAAIAALSLCSAIPAAEGGAAFEEADALCGEYGVHHYPRQAYSKTFGPLDLAQTLQFCSNLHQKVKDATSTVTLFTPPREEAAHSNACVLVGAYLILFKDWTSDALIEEMGQHEARRTFACSWTRVDHPEERVLTVSDCWAGMEIARDLGWLDTFNLVRDREHVRLACKQFGALTALYDVAFIAPDIMVAADPTTTVMDPNPETFTELFPPDLKERCDSNVNAMAKSYGATAMSQGTVTSAKTREPDDCCVVRVRVESNLTCRTTDTIDKVYDFSKFGEGPVNQKDALSFVGFLEQCGVNMVVRANLMKERGMLEESYDAHAMEMYGLRHMEIQWEDFNGGCPQRRHIAKLLRSAEGKVLMHCKGGFGRSVMLACMLSMERYDVPGNAMLGWVRIARPGSINTAAQEKLVKNLTGRLGVRRFAGLPEDVELENPVVPQQCCTVQ